MLNGSHSLLRNMSNNIRLLCVSCFLVLCFFQLVTTEEKEGETLFEIGLDIDIINLMEENKDLAKLLITSAESLESSEIENIKKDAYSVANVINMNRFLYLNDNFGKTQKFPIFTTTPLPPMTAEERKKFKFVFPKGHFMNDLLYGPDMTGSK